MTKFIDMSIRDINGACVQWAAHLKNHLGYDYDVTVQAGINNERGEVYIRGGDKFQEAHTTYSSDHIGRTFHIEAFAVDEDWDAVCKRVWEKLGKSMQRDERELRAGLKMMGGIVEHAPSFTSLVGKMFAERIKTARDEATNFMIEHHGWKAE